MYSLHKYFKQASLTPSSSSAYSFLTKKDVESANENVETALAEKPATTRRVGLKYNTYTPQQRAEIGKYAAEYGNTRAAKHFSRILGCNISESTARRLKTEYLRALSETTQCESSVHVVDSLPRKAQGRPLLLGQEIDKAVQEYIEATRSAGGVVNTTIVMAAAVGIMSTRNLTALKSHGGHIEITKSWAKSVLQRMGYVKRKCSNAGKVSPAHFAEIKEVFLADVQALVLMNEIPDDLIVNWDQTAIQLVPTGDWTMNRAGAKVIPVSNCDDKRQITAVLSASISGEYLAPQLIFQGKTDRCHPKMTFPKGWDVWHSENHWSNEDTMKRYIERIIIPFFAHKRKALQLQETQPALVLFDSFRGQTTEAIGKLLERNNILSQQIPPNCTDKLQPMDISINKPVKNGMRARFQKWYADEVQSQLKDVSVDEVKVSVAASHIKPLSAMWMISTWQEIEQRPELAINGFRGAGIVDAIAAVRD